MTLSALAAGLPGIFYHAASPGDPPFKKPGDAVAAGDTVGLIEVMKTFTPIQAEGAGIFVRYLVANEDSVMPGEPLCEIEG